MVVTKIRGTKIRRAMDLFTRPTLLWLAFALLAASAVGAQDIGIYSVQQKLDEIIVAPMENDDGGWTLTRLNSEQRLPLRLEEHEDPYIIEYLPDSARFLVAELPHVPRERISYTFRTIEWRQVNGITKTVSVWANTDTPGLELRVIVADSDQLEYRIPLGRSVVGWRQYTISVPPSLRQRDYTMYEEGGLSIGGVEVIVPPEADAAVEIGLDWLTAITDLWQSAGRDTDTIPNTW